jgi:polyhydroxyalkanoate synthesis regulator protein
MRLLKKYPNRRIYDTKTSQFVALAEIRQMIVDSVLMQIITEMETEGHESLLTNRILEELIRFYGDKIVALIGPYLEQQILQSIAAQDLLRENLTKAFTQPYPAPDQAIKQMVEQYQQFAAGLAPKAEPAPPEAHDETTDEAK